MKKRELPCVTWENIKPPYYEYPYFQGYEHYPFRPKDESFDAVNAWWLSEAATLVYAEEEFVTPQFQRVGFPEVRYFDGKSTDCFVASNSTNIFVVFRGTESRRRRGADDFQNILADVKADCNIKLVDSECGGKVHKGFLDALNEVWDGLREYINHLHTPSRFLWITGHSLGAALATLAAVRYGNVQGLYTFGSPRVGDSVFKQHFTINAYRIVNNADIIATVPPPGLYRHVGDLWYLDSNGLLHHDFPLIDMVTEGVRSEGRNIAGSFEQAMQGSFGYIPGGIRDHVPLFYAVHLWNNMIEESHPPLS